MRFWDASAIVPLLVPEVASGACAALLDSTPVVWALTPVEVLSALERRGREGALATARLAEARQRLQLLRDAWTEVRDLELVRARAERLLAVHPLRAADSLQLAAALVGCEERPAGTSFACLDRGLALAAAKEGFDVLP
jgi:predicted nucleic acid-binding protein